MSPSLAVGRVLIGPSLVSIFILKNIFGHYIMLPSCHQPSMRYWDDSLAEEQLSNKNYHSDWFHDFGTIASSVK
jgi:hypothetical protein